MYIIIIQPSLSAAILRFLPPHHHPRIHSRKPRECWECGEVGHVRNNCPKSSRSKPYINAAITENVINEDVVTNYIDSASSIHLVTSITFLTNIRDVRTEENMQTVGGELIQLTHKGKRTIATQHGTLQLSEVYYAEGVKYNLISVPKLVERGISLHLTKKEAYIEKQGVKIKLQMKHGLWTLYTKHPHIAATLRLGLGGKTNSNTWHERLGHPSDRQTKIMIKQNMIPDEAERGKEGACDTCLKTKPNRRPVPKVPERSGDIVVQVDYMPVGHLERGWKDEVGAYVYSSRKSKVIKTYPVKDASARSASQTLEDYMTTVGPRISMKTSPTYSLTQGANSRQQTGLKHVLNSV